MFRFAFALITATLMASSALGAEPIARISATSGKVLLERGQGFFAAEVGMELYAGNRVMVSEESALTIAFADCAIDIAEPTMVQIPEIAPCNAGQSALLENSIVVRPAFGAGTVDTELSGVIAAAAVAGLTLAVAILAANYEEPDKAISAP